MLFYRAALPLSRQTLTFVSGLVRTRGTEARVLLAEPFSCWSPSTGRRHASGLHSCAPSTTESVGGGSWCDGGRRMLASAVAGWRSWSRARRRWAVGQARRGDMGSAPLGGAGASRPRGGSSAIPESWYKVCELK